MQFDPKVCVIMPDASATKIRNKNHAHALEDISRNVRPHGFQLIFFFFFNVMQAKLMENSSSAAQPEETEAKSSPSCRLSGGWRC